MNWRLGHLRGSSVIRRIVLLPLTTSEFYSPRENSSLNSLEST